MKRCVGWIVGVAVLGVVLAVPNLWRAAATEEASTSTAQLEPVRLDHAALPFAGTVAPVVARRRRKRKRAASAQSARNDTAGDEKELFRRLAGRTSDVVAMLEPRGIVTCVDGPVRSVLDLSTSQLIGESLVAHVHPDDVSEVEALLAEYARQPGANLAVECRLRAAPDRWCHLETFGNRRQTDRSNAVVVRLRDVSARRQAEAALRESDELFRALGDASPVAIIVEDLDRRIMMWSAAAERMFGWASDTLVGQPNPLVPEDALEQHQNLRRRVLEGKAFTALETRRLKKDGSILKVSLSTAPLPDADGRPRGVIEIVSDVTERIELETQLRQAQKMEAVGQLAGSIAHDFNNVMTAIGGYVGLMTSLLDDAGLSADPRIDESADEERPTLPVVVQEVERAVKHADALTKGLLAFSRRQVMKPRPLNLGAVVGGMEPMLRSLIGETIELVVKAEANLDQVVADPTQIEQVILNLAVNAKDAMPSGGQLIIETANTELDAGFARHHISVVPGPYVMVAVSDDGCGMDQGTRARVFEPFFTTKEPGKGTGLGLSTAYGIVKQSGGYVWVYSEPGVGTTAKVLLPRTQVDTAPELEARVPDPAPARGTETILVVEDEEMVRVLVRQVLAFHGYTVIEAPNGEEALRLSEQYDGAIHLMVTDLIMPGMSVPEIVERLKTRRADTKVLCMSGYTDLAANQFGGIDARMPFLPKPFAPVRLASKVREVLDSPAASDSEVNHSLR